jgi:hypothetical protein
MDELRRDVFKVLVVGDKTIKCIYSERNKVSFIVDLYSQLLASWMTD